VATSLVISGLHERSTFDSMARLNDPLSTQGQHSRSSTVPSWGLVRQVNCERPADWLIQSHAGTGHAREHIDLR